MDPSAEPDVKGALRLEGLLLDEKRRPIGGARVWCSPGPNPVTSDEDGGFAFDDLAAGMYRIHARRGELYVQITLVTLRAGREPVVLTMCRGTTLILTVLDDGRPIPHARVLRDDEVIALSDGDGIARVPGFGPHFQMVEVAADGYAPAFVAMSLADDPGGTLERTVALSRGASIDGLVVGPDGSPVPDATIRLSGASWSGDVTSDHAGAWRFERVAAGAFQVQARSRAYAPAPHLILELDGITPRKDVVVRLDRGAQLTGTIRDADGHPAAGAFTFAAKRETAPERCEEFTVRADPDGRFEALGIAPGTYDVFAYDEAQASPVTRLTLTNNQRAELGFVLQASRLAGVVVDTTDQPVAEAHVRTEASFLNGDVSDSRGRFDLGAFPPGEYEVSVTRSDEPGRWHEAHRLRAGDTSAEVVLPVPATVNGRVVLDGRPMPYYGISLPGTGGPTGVRDIDGRFSFKLTPGTHRLVLVGPGTARKTISGINIEAGEVLDLGEIAMDHGQRITGRVLDASGAPVPGARVVIGVRGRDLVRSGQPMQRWFDGDFETTTDASGAFTFAGVAPLHLPNARPTPIAATHPDHGASIATVVPKDDAHIDLVLVATGAIDGVVEGYDDPFGMVQAQRRGEPMEQHLARIEKSGRFHFDALPAGDYAISVVELPGRSSAPAPALVTVEADQRAMVTLAAKPTTSID